MGKTDWVPSYLRAHIDDAVHLDREEQTRLAILARGGDERARETLIRSNIKFIISRVLKWYSINKRSFPDYSYCSDLLSEGMIGFSRGINGFYESRGYTLLTYAVYWIDAKIRERIQKDLALVKIGTTPEERLALSNPARFSIKYQELRGRLDSYVSIDMLSSQGAERDGRPLNGRFALVSPELTPEEAYSADEFRHVTKINIERALSILNSMEADIIRQRHLSDSEHRVTLENLGEKYDVSREYIRKIELRAFKKMRVALNIIFSGRQIKDKMKKTG